MSDLANVIRSVKLEYQYNWGGLSLWSIELFEVRGVYVVHAQRAWADEPDKITNDYVQAHTTKEKAFKAFNWYIDLATDKE